MFSTVAIHCHHFRGFQSFRCVSFHLRVSVIDLSMTFTTGLFKDPQWFSFEDGVKINGLQLLLNEKLRRIPQAIGLCKRTCYSGTIVKRRKKHWQYIPNCRSFCLQKSSSNGSESEKATEHLWSLPGFFLVDNLFARGNTVSQTQIPVGAVGAGTALLVMSLLVLPGDLDWSYKQNPSTFHACRDTHQTGIDFCHPDLWVSRLWRQKIMSPGLWKRECQSDSHCLSMSWDMLATVKIWFFWRKPLPWESRCHLCYRSALVSPCCVLGFLRRASHSLSHQRLALTTTRCCLLYFTGEKVETWCGYYYW